MDEVCLVTLILIWEDGLERICRIISHVKRFEGMKSEIMKQPL